MIFHSESFVGSGGTFRFPKSIRLKAHPCLAKNIFAELFGGYTYRLCTADFDTADTLTLTAGRITPPALNGADYAFSITEEGFALTGKTERDLIHAFFTLADRIRAEDGKNGSEAVLDCGELYENAKIGLRIVHFCIFPETELWEITRFIRLAAALKYTHLILEFWGMLRYDCEKALSWPQAYSKEELRPILSEAKELGLSLIPMINHWGHATASRVMHGKHVVLDQNPALQPLFDEDGWCWNIQSERVRALLREMRGELCELFGEGEYFHIGCDEAYNFDLTKKENRDELLSYLNELSDELKAMGRRAIMWGDMLLAPNEEYKNKLYCFAPSEAAAADLRQRLSRNIVIADWQYEPKIAPVETALVFKHDGFDTLLCPWDLGCDPIKVCTQTLKDEGLFGILHTTWHTLSKGMPFVSLSAKGGFENIEAATPTQLRTATAALLRKVFPSEGDYRKTGFAKYQIDTLW